VPNDIVNLVGLRSCQAGSNTCTVHMFVAWAVVSEAIRLSAEGKGKESESLVGDG
jgi:hypothetical protein